MLLIAGIWLLCCAAALIALVPLCRMARLADEADERDERTVQTAGDVHAAFQALTGDGAPSGEPPFVTDLAPEPQASPAADRAPAPPLPQPRR